MQKLIRTDWHIHTTLSDCAQPEATPEAIIAAAKAAGLEAIGFTDHVIYPEQRERPRLVREALPQDAGDLKLYVGCEADMQSPTRATIDRDFAAGLDYVIMSASHLYLPEVELPPDVRPREMAALIIVLMDAAIASGLADTIAHPFGVPGSPFTFDQIMAEVDRDALRRTGEAAARAGVAMECNSRYFLQSPDAATWLFSLLLETGVKFAINSDAHHPRGVGCQGPRFATEQELRDHGITEDRLWHADDRVSAGGGSRS